MVPVFPAGEAREVAGGEGFEASGAGANGGGREFGVVQEGLGRGVFEDVHDGLHKGLPSK